MDYLPIMSRDSRDGRPLIMFIQNSRLRRSLEKLGYSSYAFQTPYEPTNITQSDWYVTGRTKLRINTLTGLLLMNSVGSFGVKAGLIKPPMPIFRDEQENILSNFSALEEITRKPGPKFIFFHVIVPHPPFIFNQNGPIKPDEVYILSDGHLFPGLPGDFMRGYREQLTYVNKLVIRAVDVIFQQSAGQAVVIIQGDHGPGVYFTESISSTCLKERSAILNAIYLPGGTQDGLYPSISPVNTFRLVFQRDFSNQISLLEDRVFYSNFSQPYNFIDVTNQTELPCKVP